MAVRKLESRTGEVSLNWDEVKAAIDDLNRARREKLWVRDRDKAVAIFKSVDSSCSRLVENLQSLGEVTSIEELNDGHHNYLYDYCRNSWTRERPILFAKANGEDAAPSSEHMGDGQIIATKSSIFENPLTLGLFIVVILILCATFGSVYYMQRRKQNIISTYASCHRKLIRQRADLRINEKFVDGVIDTGNGVFIDAYNALACDSFDEKLPLAFTPEVRGRLGGRTFVRENGDLLTFILGEKNAVTGESEGCEVDGRYGVNDEGQIVMYLRVNGEVIREELLTLSEDGCVLRGDSLRRGEVDKHAFLKLGFPTECKHFSAFFKRTTYTCSGGGGNIFFEPEAPLIAKSVFHGDGLDISLGERQQRTISNTRIAKSAVHSLIDLESCADADSKEDEATRIPSVIETRPNPHIVFSVLDSDLFIKDLGGEEEAENQVAEDPVRSTMKFFSAGNEPVSARMTNLEIGKVRSNHVTRILSSRPMKSVISSRGTKAPDFLSVEVEGEMKVLRKVISRRAPKTRLYPVAQSMRFVSRLSSARKSKTPASQLGAEFKGDRFDVDALGKSEQHENVIDVVKLPSDPFDAVKISRRDSDAVEDEKEEAVSEPSGQVSDAIPELVIAHRISKLSVPSESSRAVEIPQETEPDENVETDAAEVAEVDFFEQGVPFEEEWDDEGDELFAGEAWAEAGD